MGSCDIAMNLFALELSLMLMLYLEDPGPFNSAHEFKTVSLGLQQHPGIGAALFVCVAFRASHILQVATHQVVAAVLAWGVLASLMSVLVFEEPEGSNHAVAACCFFGSTLALGWLKFAEGTTSLLAVCAATAACAMVVAAFVAWPSALGAWEVVYLYFAVNAWVDHRKGAGAIEDIAINFYKEY